MRPRAHALLTLASIALVAGCSSENGDGGGGNPPVTTCPTADERFEQGDPTGHADPYGAKQAGQARAGRLTSEDQIVQPAHGRQRVRVGDFVLVNERIAVTIEDKGLSDGYARFGGEILAVDRVGDDGRPLGTSYYGETLMAIGIEMIEPDSVSVMNDGSDGKAAVVRVVGRLTRIPFLDGSLSAIFPRRYGLQAAYEYVLEPGKNHLLVRVGLKNPSEEPVSLVVGKATDEMHGFFHYSRNQMVSEKSGFAKPSGYVDWIGFVNDGTSFAWRLPAAEKLGFGLEVSGFVYTLGPGFKVEGCSSSFTDHVQVIAGGSDCDSLREAIRSADGAPAWRPLTGSVKQAGGEPVAGAMVHLLDANGVYLSRTESDAKGAFTVHAPPGESAQLVAQRRGFSSSEPLEISADQTTADLVLPANGAIRVTAHDAAGPVPVRVQVVPTAPSSAAPREYGVPDEQNGRLHQEFAVTGDSTLSVPPGEHRVIVTRGTEWELVDQIVDVSSGQTVDVDASLTRSVDSTGWMCADFHIHSFFSADSNDPVVDKVKSAIADGLEIPVSSEHEWVIDFQPTVVELGLQKWAFGMPSEELTTFTWGHFGVVPLFPKTDEVNNGAIEWIGRKPPEMFAEVQSRPEGPVLIVNHPSGDGFGAYFSQAGLDDDTGTSKKSELWSTDFDAIEVFNDSDFESNRDGSVRDWFSLLRAGKTMWAVGSSDSHHIRSSPVGYPRSCLFFGHDDPQKLTANIVRDAIMSGALIVSGGLFMTVEGPNGVKPGSKLPATGSADFTVTVQTASFVDATTLETIVDGVSQKVEPLAPLGSGPGKRFVNTVTVTLDATKPRSFVVFHAKGEQSLDPLHPGRRPFAVSNPIFFEQ